MKTINLKIDETKKKLFKKAANDRGTNMQTILSAFVDLYLSNPDRFLLKMEAGNHMFPQSEEITPQDINYLEKDYSNMKVKQLSENGAKKDEYYVKIKAGLSKANVCDYMKATYSGCEVGLLDPDNLLGLDYDIYVIAKDEMIKDSMMETFESLNQKLGA